MRAIETGHPHEREQANVLYALRERNSRKLESLGQTVLLGLAAASPRNTGDGRNYLACCLTLHWPLMVGFSDYRGGNPTKNGDGNQITGETSASPLCARHGGREESGRYCRCVFHHFGHDRRSLSDIVSQKKEARFGRVLMLQAAGQPDCTQESSRLPCLLLACKAGFTRRRKGHEWRVLAISCGGGGAQPVMGLRSVSVENRHGVLVNREREVGTRLC